MKGRHPRTVRRRVDGLIRLASQRALIDGTLSDVIGVLGKLSARPDVLVTEDLHVDGLDSGSGLELGHAISSPRPERPPRPSAAPVPSDVLARDGPGLPPVCTGT